MKITTYAPVTVTVLDRYEHFKRCVESLSRCTHADKTELVIGLDYPPSEKYVEGWKKICDYVPTIIGFKKVTVFKREENYGICRNTSEIREYAFARYDQIITTEDDNEFSPCFLDYMNKALEKYKDDERVFCITGYVQPKYSHIDDERVLFMSSGNAWGMGIWKKKEEQYKDSMNSVFGDILFSLKNTYKVFREMPFRIAGAINCYEHGYDYGDYKRGCICSLNGIYQLAPAHSLVRNWGQDGSGLHSGISKEIMQEEISTETSFDIPDVPVRMRPEVAQILWMNRLPQNRLRRVLVLGRYILSYIQFRVKNGNR